MKLLATAIGAIIAAIGVAHMPRTLRAIGIFIILAGLVTPFFGVERSRAMLDWWSIQGLVLMRAWAGATVIFGLFVTYVVTFPRRTAA